MTIPSEPGRPGSGVTTLLQFIRKERTVFTRRDRVYVLGVFFLASLQTVTADEAFFVLGLALAGALAVYVPIIEWYQGTDPMLHSLPIRRGTVVLARYLLAVSAGGVAGILWVTTGRLLLPILDAGRATPAIWMTVEGVITFFVFVGLLVALFFPVYFRLGMGRGSMVFLGLSAALLAIGYATAGLAGGPARAGILGIAPPSALVLSRVSALVGSLGVAGTLTLILIGLSVVFAVSLKLSQRWFERREF
jgi:hypothetical protein